MKKIVIFIAALVMAVCVNAQNASTSKHEVQSGETLTSIARNYGISVKELLKLNPSLNPDCIMAGQKINVPGNAKTNTVAVPVQTVPVQTVPVQTVPAQQSIQSAESAPVTVVPQNRPKYKTTHEVQKKETIYSISKQYEITEEELIIANPQLGNGKLKKGAVLNIPYTEEENKKYEEAKKKVEEEKNLPKVKRYSTLRAAVILPFSLDTEQMTPDMQKMANLYQGFLLAVDSLKTRGYNVEVYAYDETSEDILEILKKPMMMNVQLIVGPIRQENIVKVAQYAHTANITHVVPLSNEASIVNEHPTTYQVNVSNPALYPQVFNRFIALHRNDNIIFIGMNDKNDNNSYILDFKKALDDEKIIYSRASVSEFNALKDMIKPDVRTVIIPSSGSPAAFNTLCTKLNGLTLPANARIQLFGYPEWQALPSKHEKNLIKYNCQFFTSFYSNQTSQRTQDFNAKFFSNFKQYQYASFPRYGELGYDIASYFLSGLKEFGSAFHENIHNIPYQSLEFPLHFEKKNSWSGYENKSLLIVTYNLDGRVFVR